MRVMCLCPTARYVGYGDEGSWETLEGMCAMWKESLEQYMETAGTHYKRCVDIFYDGLVSFSLLHFACADWLSRQIVSLVIICDIS